MTPVMLNLIDYHYLKLIEMMRMIKMEKSNNKVYKDKCNNKDNDNDNYDENIKNNDNDDSDDD